MGGGGGGGQVVGPDSQARPRPSSAAPNHSTSVMAFGVKWNETGEESGRESAELQAQGPGEGRGRRPAPPHPAAPPSRPPGRRGGGRTSGPETPSSHSAPDRTGRGRRGRDEAVSHFPSQSKTHRHAPGTPARPETEPGAPTRAPPARPAAGGGGGAGNPPSRPGRRPAEELGGEIVGSHTPLALLPSLRSSCWPRESASSRRGRLLTARHRRLVFRTRAGGGSRQLRESLSPGTRPTLGASQAQR